MPRPSAGALQGVPADVRPVARGRPHVRPAAADGPSVTLTDATGPAPGSTAARLEAHAQAYELFEAVLGGAGPEVLNDAVHEARAQGWTGVECLLEYARATHQCRAGRDWRAALTRTTDLARGSGDPDLEALALAARAELVQRDSGSATDDEVEHGLAYAVVLLDTPHGTGVDKAVGYVSCASAYLTRGLYELTAEMCDRAERVLRAPLPVPLDRMVAPTRRTVATLRLLNQVSWACGLFDRGDQAGAAEVARSVTEADGVPAGPGEGPGHHGSDVVALHVLLQALAGAPHLHVAPQWRSRIEQHPAGAARSCLLLADALVLRRAGDHEAAARAATAALPGFTDDTTAPRIVALRIAALLPDDHPAMRYGDTLGRFTWRSRLALLAGARAKTEAVRLAAQHDELARHAYADDLTGLANRRAYATYLQGLRRRPAGCPAAVVLVDVDLFKEVNDRFGHVVGDRVLGVVGDVLKRAVRGHDLAARIGGDEFVLVLDGVPADLAARRAEQVLESVRSFAWALLGEGLAVTLSIGLAHGEASAVDLLVHRADRSLYAVKAAGRAAVGPVF